MATIKKAEFVRPNDPILSKVAEEIHLPALLSTETSDYIEAMLRVGYGEQTERDKPLLVGLAAPQIGISKRIILVDVIADGKGKVGKLEAYINPEVTWHSVEEEKWYEGCFSTSRVCGIVSRPSKIKIQAWNREGKPIEEEYAGYTARIFQHEIDHLNGKEFVNHIKNDENLHWVEREEFPEYRDKQGWKNWPKKCSREKWERIKLFGE